MKSKCHVPNVNDYVHWNAIQGDPFNVRQSLFQKVLTFMKFLFFKY